MKKTTTMKDGNRFKFVPFSERIANIKVDVFHRVAHRNEEEDAEQKSYFQLAIEKWTVLNRSKEWLEFKQAAVVGGVYSLPQLLNQKDRIAKLFIEEIQKQTQFSLEPILEVLVAFVKDLQQEFYQYYPPIAKQLIELLKLRDAAVVELAFVSLAYMFKYLVRNLVKDLGTVLEDLAPLLKDSLPEYIKDFAAQSFAFVARRVKDKNKFLTLVLAIIQTKPELAAGCGKLITETIHGIQGQPHSSSTDMLQVLFHGMGKSELPQTLLVELASHVVDSYIARINPSHSNLFNVLTDVLRQKASEVDGDNALFMKGVKPLLKLSLDALNFRYGIHLKDPMEFTDVILLLLGSPHLSLQGHKLITEIAVQLLMSSNIKLPQDIAARLSKTMLNEPKEVMLAFIESISGYTGFEATILPKFLELLGISCSGFHIDKDLVATLAKVVAVKSTKPDKTWVRYPLEFKGKARNVPDMVLEHINSFGSISWERMEEVGSCILLLPHISPLNSNMAIGTLSKIIDQIISKIAVIDATDNADAYIFLLELTLDSVKHLELKEANHVKFTGLLEALLPKVASSLVALKSLEVLLEILSTQRLSINSDTLQLAHNQAVSFLTSPYHMTRVMALRILLNLELLEHGDGSRMYRVIETCLNAEEVPLTVHDYREAVMHITNLHREKLNIEEALIEIPLRFLFGLLFCNFKLLEEHICEAIRTYITASMESYINSFKDQLALPINILQEGTSQFSEAPGFLFNRINSFVKSDDRPDFLLYKVRLWNALDSNLTGGEAYEQHIIDTALEFLQTQMRSNLRCSPHSIKVHATGTNLAVNEEEEEEEQDEEKDGPGKPYRKLVSSLSCTQLSALTKFSSKHKEMQLRSLCMDLLTDGYAPLRKAALECLLSRRTKKLQAYRQNLLNFIDDSGLKESLVFFQMDKDSGVVDEAHRPMLMPIVLRLLYSKMISGGPIHRGSKGTAALYRRTLVMRFLAGCHKNEIEEFLKMAFNDFKLNPDGEGSSCSIADRMTAVDINAVPFPRKLLSALHLVQVVLDHIGGLLPEKLQRFLVQVVLSAAAIGNGCLEQRADIHVGYIAALRKIRSLSLDILATVFDKFTCYPWNEDDIEAIFRITIWPVAEKLAFEGVYSPTSLLKMFAIWSQHPRLFKLLTRHMDNDATKTPLSMILKLLVNDQTAKPVSASITSILANLLTLRESDAMETDDPSPPEIDILKIRPIDVEVIARLNLKEELNYGSQLLIPHVSIVLDHLTKQLASSEKRGLTQVDTLVLARMTELATSAEHGDQLIELLLNVLANHPPKDEEVLVNTLLTVQHLLAIVSEPNIYIRSLAQLFSSIEVTQGRKVLISCLENLAIRCQEVEVIANIARDLNAFDRRWIDQCDFNKRLDTFKLIRKLASEEKLSVDTALYVIHSSFFFLRTEKDLSLRDSTELCLKTVCPALLRSIANNTNDNELITETLLRHLRLGVQGKDDRFKASCISLLGVLARESGSSHIVFRDLSVFSNSVDLEVDFFENIHHLQMYRRVRALHKFHSICKTLRKPPSPRSLTQFILPLGSQFLCSEDYAGKNSLVDAAIAYVGMVTRLLPWYQYQTTLTYYLLKLRTNVEFQKQCVRLVIAILDSFHFDISHSSQAPQTVAAKEPEHVEDENSAEPTHEEQVSSDEKNIIGDEEQFNNTLADNLEKEEAANDEPMEMGETTLAVDDITILKPGAAARIQRVISGKLLDQLYKAIGQRTSVENMHKVNKKRLGPDKDEEDVLRVPIAVALVKLLQKLPGNALDRQLPGIFTKLCTFLKSHLESVRRATRETLQQIIVSVGPDRLPLLLKEMTDLLTKGFQCHVLVFTIHAVIQAVQPVLRPGDLDKNLPLIMRVCGADLFGNASEEKEVFRLQVKHKEVRSHKSFNLLHLVAQFITDKCLMDLILPIKQVLSTRHSHKIHTKCRECLRRIVLGLAVNTFIPKESLFVFMYGAASESINQLKPVPPPPIKKPHPKDRPDSLIIAPEVHSRSISVPVKNSARSGDHIIIEFGLSLLLILLKQDKVKNMDLRPYLDPLVPVLANALDSQHVKVTTSAIQCLIRMLKHDLPSLREHIKPMTDVLFTLLHKFAASGLSKGDNFSLVLAAFKMVSVIVRDVDYYTLSCEQLKALLFYAEQDIHDGSRQAVAFGLLKSILRRRLKAPELHPVMLKVADLSICCDQAHVRQQARQTMLRYMMEYPLGKKVDNVIGFYIAQLSYELESGRQSALEMIFSFINSFPEKTLKNQSALFFLTLGTTLANDESPDCKKMVAAVIKGLLAKLDQQGRDDLFEMITIWLKQKKKSHRRLAIQLAGVFVSHEKEDFDRRLVELLPLLQKQLISDAKPGRFVKPAAEEETAETDNDQLLYLLFVLLVKICANSPKILSETQYRGHVSLFVDAAHNLLCHEHEWVRVGAAQFLGSVFASIKPGILSAALNGKESDVMYWDSHTFSMRLKSLVLDHTAQFDPAVELNQDFIDQLMKNLVYFARVLKDVKQIEGEKSINKKNEDTSECQISFTWLVRRMRRIVNLEIAQSPSNYTLRTAVLMWIGAVTVCLSKEELMPCLYNLLAPVVREEEVAQGSTSKSPIANLVKDVASKLKKKVGVDEYAAVSIKLQARLMEKRAIRKTTRAQEFVTDPERAAKRKIEKQQRKKENKKLKMEVLKGKKAGKYKGKAKKRLQDR